MRSSENSLEAEFSGDLLRRPVYFFKNARFKIISQSFFIQNRALCKHIVFAAVQFLQNQVVPPTIIIRNSNPKRPFQRFTQGRNRL